MVLRKESVEDKWMKKVTGGKDADDIMGKKGTMVCQSCGNDVLAEPNDKGKIVCPKCGGICRGIIDNNKEKI